MEKITLHFADDTSEECSCVGQVTMDGTPYAVFLGEEKDLYVYEYRKLSKNKHRLVAVRNKKEFDAICDRINSIIRIRDDGGAE
jgi:hypothetical protein